MDTEKGSLRPALTSAFAAVVEPKTAIYAAVPVTSGLRLWNLAKTLRVSDLVQVPIIAASRYRTEVFVPNRAYAVEFVASARKRHGLVVIDPSRLVVNDWSQGQYWQFWEEIISVYANAMLLSPEWAFSKGCIYECIFAIKHGIPVLSGDGRPLGIDDLRSQAKHAIGIRESFHIQAEFLDEFMNATSKPIPG